MQHRELVLPMFAMVLLTVVVFVANLAVRIRAVQAGAVKPNYFKIFDGKGLVPPERLVQLKNHIDNLFQVPVLFYAVCLAVIATQVVPPHTLELAWAFVAARVAHSLIHTTYNKVVHRLAAFLLSNVILMVMWIRLVLALTTPT